MPWFQMSWPATQFCEAVAWPQLRSRHGQMVSTCTNPNFKRYETLDGCRLWYDVIWSDCKMRLQWYRNLPIPLQRFHVWNTRIPVPTKTSWGMPSGVVRWSCWMAQCLSAAAQYPPGNCTAISFVLDPELWTLKLLVYLYIYISICIHVCQDSVHFVPNIAAPTSRFDQCCAQDIITYTSMLSASAGKWTVVLALLSGLTFVCDTIGEIEVYTVV